MRTKLEAPSRRDRPSVSEGPTKFTKRFPEKGGLRENNAGLTWLNFGPLGSDQPANENERNRIDPAKSSWSPRWRCSRWCAGAWAGGTLQATALRNGGGRRGRSARCQQRPDEREGVRRGRSRAERRQCRRSWRTPRSDDGRRVRRPNICPWRPRWSSRR